MPHSNRDPADGGYRHTALMYAGRDDFVRRTVPFLQGGVADGEPILVVVGREKIDLLRAALAGDADRVQFADMADIGANPARIIPAWQDFVRANTGRRRLRGIGEPIYPERSPAELVECQHHERLLNPALDGSQLSLVCPYDTTALDTSVIREALRSHPRLAAHGDERTNQSYARDVAAGLLGRPLPDPPADARAIAFAEQQFATVREFVEQEAEAVGMAVAKREDLVLAVHELATNSVRHAGGAGTLRVWNEPGALVCEVRDRGLIDDALVDRRRPSGDRGGGFGLWIANRLCDLVQVRSGVDGSTVRLHMRLS